MEIADISKMASRKRLNTDAEKLREKVSRETAKIIKLKVAQDTAYWDVKERLQQLTAAHERLQRNMLEVQMQHEAASARCQAELLMRPDTHSRVSVTRDMCDALEEYAERARRTVERCRTDQRALGAAYEQCAERARTALAQSRARTAEARTQSAAHADQLARAHAALGAARERHDSLERARRDIALRLEHAHTVLEQREAQAREAGERAALQDAHAAQLKRTADSQQIQLEEARANVHAAEERAARLRDELSAARDALRDGQEEASATALQLRAELTALGERARRLEETLCDSEQRVQQLEAEVSRGAERASALERDKCELRAQLCSTAQQLRAAEERAAADERRRAELSARIDELLAAAEEQRARHAEEAAACGRQRDAELDEKARTITKLMGELSAAAGAHEAARRQHDTERRAAAASAERLEALVRDKDAAIEAQVRAVRDARADNERLHQRIANMQGTIDNIQKELTGRAPPAAPASRAERDEGPDADLLYGFLSDTSTDGDALDRREVKRRFELLARDQVRPPQGIIPLSQVKKELQKKSRAFFKNKRLDNKLKKNME